MPPLPETILLVLPPFAPLFSHRVWVPCATVAARGDSGPRGTHGYGSLASDGAAYGAPVHHLSNDVRYHASGRVQQLGEHSIVSGNTGGDYDVTTPGHSIHPHIHDHRFPSCSPREPAPPALYFTP